MTNAVAVPSDDLRHLLNRAAALIARGLTEGAYKDIAASENYARRVMDVLEATAANIPRATPTTPPEE